MSRLAALAGIARSLLMYYGIPFRQRRMVRFYAQIIQPGDLCFDIGAHVGNRTRALLRAGARVVAVEPQPALMGLLRRWYGRHPGVVLVQAAVGAAEGEATLLASRRHPTVSTLSAGWAEQVGETPGFAPVAWDARLPVQVTTLDALIDAHGRPAFCKIDVEGYELEALRGLSTPIPLIAFEFIPAALDVALGCLDVLAGLGPYRFKVVRGETQRLPSGEWLSAAETAALLRESAGGRSGDVYARLSER